MQQKPLMSSLTIKENVASQVGNMIKTWCSCGPGISNVKQRGTERGARGCLAIPILRYVFACGRGLRRDSYSCTATGRHRPCLARLTTLTVNADQGRHGIRGIRFDYVYVAAARWHRLVLRDRRSPGASVPAAPLRPRAGGVRGAGGRSGGVRRHLAPRQWYANVADDQFVAAEAVTLHAALGVTRRPALTKHEEGVLQGSLYRNLATENRRYQATVMLAKQIINFWKTTRS